MATETVTVDGVEYEIPAGLSFRAKQKYVRALQEGKSPVVENPDPAPEPYQVGATDILRAAGQGLYSFGDEIEAGLRTGFGGWGDYRSTKDQINKEIELAREANPYAMYGAELGAGFLVPGGNIARGVKLANTGAKTIGQAAKQGVYQGMFDGALTGLGAADDITDPLATVGDTLLGTATGGVLGGGLGGAIPGIGSLFTRNDQANEFIRKAAEEAGLDADMIFEEISRLGPEATLADVSPELRGLALAAQGKAGPSRQNLGMLADRNKTAPQRLVDDIEEQTGANIDSARVEKARLEAERTATARDDYAPVDAATFVADDVAHLMENPVARKSIDEAIQAFAAKSDNPYNMGQLKRLMDGDPEMDIPGAVPARILADARTFLSQRAEELKAKPGQGKRIDVILDTVRQFDEVLGEISGYLDANARFSRASTLMSDIDNGIKFAQRSDRYIDDKALLNEIQGDPGRQAALAVGAQSDLISDILNSGGGRQTGLATTRLGPAAQSDLRQRAAQVDLSNSIDRENTFYDTFAQLTPTINSKTGPSKEAADRLNSDMSIMGRLTDLMSPGRAAAKGAANEIQKKFNLKNKEIARNIADRLLKQGLTEEEIYELLSTPEGARKIASMIGKIQGPLQSTARAATVGILGD